MSVPYSLHPRTSRQKLTWDDLAVTLPAAANIQYGHLVLPGSSFSMQEQHTRSRGRWVAARLVCSWGDASLAGLFGAPSAARMMLGLPYSSALLSHPCSSGTSITGQQLMGHQLLRRDGGAGEHGQYCHREIEETYCKRPWIFTCSCGLVSRISGLCDNLFLSLSP